MTGFHEVSFPLPLGFGASGGPERRTDIVTLGSGREERNARWAHARRRFDAGPGLRSHADLGALVAFFEERRGRLFGFRFRDPLDHSSAAGGGLPSPGDQLLEAGDGTRTVFALQKRYGTGASAYLRPIAKPVPGSVRVAVAGAETTACAVDHVAGTVAFAAPPPAGSAVSAGFLFDVPVRFDVDRLEIDLTAFRAGRLVSVPLVEIVP